MRHRFQYIPFKTVTPLHLYALEANRHVFELVAKLSAPGSSIVFDTVNANFIDQECAEWRPASSTRWDPRAWGRVDPAAFLGSMGFDDVVVADVRDLKEQRARGAIPARLREPCRLHYTADSRETLELYVYAVKKVKPKAGRVTPKRRHKSVFP